jgi:hypothetical protein
MFRELSKPGLRTPRRRVLRADQDRVVAELERVLAPLKVRLIVIGEAILQPKVPREVCTTLEAHAAAYVDIDHRASPNEEEPAAIGPGASLLPAPGHPGWLPPITPHHGWMERTLRGPARHLDPRTVRVIPQRLSARGWRDETRIVEDQIFCEVAATKRLKVRIRKCRARTAWSVSRSRLAPARV